MQKFMRQHPRITIIVNTLMPPLLVPYGVFMVGVPTIFRELINWPRYVRDQWGA